MEENLADLVRSLRELELDGKDAYYYALGYLKGRGEENNNLLVELMDAILD